MRPEQEPSTNWDWVLFQKMADVEDATKKFTDNIPEEFKTAWQKEPENIRDFVVMLSLLDDKERRQLKEDFKAGKAKNHVLAGHDLGNCLMLYEVFSGKAMPKENGVI